MARWHEATTILEAAIKWKDLCLLRGGSIFSEHRVWTKENFHALDQHYVQNLDYGDGTFFQKLKDQLEAAPPGAKQLAAEVLWVMYLIVHKSSMTREKKLFQIRQVWEWSGEKLPENHWATDDLLEAGVSNPGIAYHTHRWRELLFLVLMGRDWVGLELERKERLLRDPWDFANWLEAREQAAGRQTRHALLFLLFPEQFERIVTGHHKKDILKGFLDRLPQGFEIDYKDRIAVDQAICMVRERLEEETPEEEVDFYLPKYREVWSPTDDDGDGDEGTVPGNKGQAEKWFKDRFGDVRVWALSPGEGARMWPEFKKEGITAISWDEVGDLTEYASKEDVKDELIRLWGGTNPFNNTAALWQFAKDTRPGDVIIAKRGRSGLLGWGIVKGDYQYLPERAEYQHVRKVDWNPIEPVDIPRDRWITNKTFTDFTPYLEWVQLAFGLMEPVGGNGDNNGNGKDDYNLNHALKDLFFTKSEFTQILDSMSRWKNIILQGPPGVGKTFIAKRIAWTLIGRKVSDPIEMVQFHQSYAYEDFIQGWRPTESGGFTLRNGVFFEYCMRAEKDMDTPHVFIIDEINRGNLSRIFGELLMLIEPDKRGPSHAIPLTYSEPGQRFSVPPNVHILGMMNTADRSLAMVDYALRRRFAFISLQPAFGKDPFHDYLFEAGVEDSVVALIDSRMGALNEKIHNDSKNLGPGFEIGHSYFVPTGDEEGALDKNWYRGVIRSQVEPLLREYWFDQGSQVDEFIEELLA